MNGIHDMGGMHGMGRIEYAPDEPVFHEPWERRVWGLIRSVGAYGRGRWGSSRYDLERMPPAEYLRSYYERWFQATRGKIFEHEAALYLLLPVDWLWSTFGTNGKSG